MFHLNLRTAASPPPTSSGATAGTAVTAPADTPALNEVPWTVIDADENESFESTPSTRSGGGDGTNESGSSGTASPQLSEPQVLVDQGPYPHCPIFIPSKGRCELERSTMATLLRDLVPFVLVVEQDEVKAYSALLDRLVGQNYGFAGMVYSSPTTGAAPGSPAKEAEAKDSKENGATIRDSAVEAAADDLWDFPCACCCRGDGGSRGSNTKGSGSPFTAVETLAHRLSKSFHHGYVFEPPTQNTASEQANDAHSREEGSAETGAHLGNGGAFQGAAAERVAAVAGESGTSPPRRPSPAFVLRDVNDVRALFRIEVLPEANRGVSYVRNYILQVLVPRMMVACGVDQSGNMEELCLTGPGEHSTLTPAALRSVALDPDVYNALQNKTDMEKYLDTRRSRATAQLSGSGGGRGAKPYYAGLTAGAYGGAAVETATDNANRPAASSLMNGTQVTRDTPRLLHGLFGFYWVLDDDIYGFYELQGTGQKQQRISSRTMLREVESRLRLLRRNADLASPPPPSVPPAGFVVSASAGSPTGYGIPQQQYVFTGKEDALANNYISGAKGRLPTLQNYSLYYSTACFSLEYGRFALSSAPDSLAVNSYNNIACLFNYTLLHNPPQMRYFPPGVPNVRRPEDTLVGYLGHSMLWYRFAIREDYDFTLQLVARGLYTLRFRSLSFEVPQMMKVRGGMTDYYRNCQEEIRQQNNRFVLQWPAVAQHWVKGKEDNKRDDIRVRWDLLSPARAKHPGAFLYLNAPLPQLQPQRSDEGKSDTAGAESHKRARPTSPTAGALESSSGAPRARDGNPTPSPVASAAQDWKGGYVVERWRDISPAEAKAHVGLIALPSDAVHIGQTVAAIPPFFEQQPSVVLATVIDRSVKEESASSKSHVVWTAVAQDVRGMPFLHIETCYQPPEEGIVTAAEKLDRFFTGLDA
ncbi:hypothetical protein ABB37_05186 [Leptomonas pyrrhocoris]|uniref:Uncharacterized protein n=1 Tax=Leptomonas pyrrhocoris TaxID=157538 RepID=A0A0M9G1E1_LEPPY|nr:hypothetical protein ABB37_05186 [Leptomonas pyrrhocoris]KPA80209.1 hypothetical protein ABB37_05186 [Leptomonas pyrrhocoris]|eukprot:XP_015658648.1 hypothetical protein ABB37_05186 [Leptomonas pyrrhocoris]